MEWSTGTMLFYSGLAGLGVTFVAAVLAAIVLVRGNKKIKRKLDQEYGAKTK